MSGRPSPLIRLAGLLSSPALAVALLSALALLAALGTLVPAQDLRAWVAALPAAPRAAARWLDLDDWYRSVPFRGLAALVLFQLLFCSLERALRAGAQLRAGHSLPGHLPTVAVPLADPDGARGRLLSRGYGVSPAGGSTLWRHGIWSLRGTVVHLSVVLVILGGAVAGLFGSVATTWAPEGDWVGEALRFPDETSVPLPFSLKVARITERYPLALRLGLLWKEGGGKEAPVELASGGTVALPGTSLTAELLRVATDLRSADLLLRDGDREVAIVRAGPDHPYSPLPFDLFIVASRGRREPEWFGVTAVVREGDAERKVAFGINEPLAVGGRTVALTAYRRGEGSEAWIAGLQISSTPGLGVAALGALLLTGALLAYLVPVREARIVGGPGGARLLLRGAAPRARLVAEAEAAARGATP